MSIQLPGAGSPQSQREKIVLKAGTVVKVGGFPFRLINDTEVEGHHLNLMPELGQAAGPGQRAQGFGSGG